MSDSVVPKDGASAKKSQLPDVKWVRRQREASFGLLTGGVDMALPQQGGVSRSFADGRYREVTARIAATTKELEAVNTDLEARREDTASLTVAVVWTVAAGVLVFLGFLLGDLASVAGGAILESFNE